MPNLTCDQLFSKQNVVIGVFLVYIENSLFIVGIRFWCINFFLEAFCLSVLFQNSVFFGLVLLVVVQTDLSLSHFGFWIVVCANLLVVCIAWWDGLWMVYSENGAFLKEPKVSFWKNKIRSEVFPKEAYEKTPWLTWHNKLFTWHTTLFTWHNAPLRWHNAPLTWQNTPLTWPIRMHRWSSTRECPQVKALCTESLLKGANKNIEQCLLFWHWQTVLLPEFTGTTKTVWQHSVPEKPISTITWQRRSSRMWIRNVECSHK